MQPSILGLKLVVPLHGIWLDAASGVVAPEVLWKHYLDPDTNLEERLAAALLVCADGEPWNTTDHSEEFEHISSWLEATTRLLGGSTSVFIWAWEESHMRAERVDDLVMLSETTHHRHLQLPPVCFALHPFALALRDVTRPSVEIVAALKRLAAQHHPQQWSAAVALEDRMRSPQSESAEPMSREAFQAALDEMRAIEEANLREVLTPGYEPPARNESRERQAAFEDVLEALAGESLTEAWTHLDRGLSAR